MIIMLTEVQDGSWGVEVGPGEGDPPDRPPPDGGTIGFILLSVGQHVLKTFVRDQRQALRAQGHETSPKVIQLPASQLPPDFLKNLRKPPEG